MFNFQGFCKPVTKRRNSNSNMETNGGVAQLGEHLLCKQGVHGFEPRHLHQPKGDSKDSRKQKKTRLPKGKETGCKGS